VFEVDGNFNGVDAIKKASYLFGFLNDDGLVFWLEMTMTSGNIDLHGKLQGTGLLKIRDARKSLSSCKFVRWANCTPFGQPPQIPFQQ